MTKKEKTEYKRRWYQANREQIRKYNSEYYEANRERIAAYKRAYYQANRDELLENATRRIRINGQHIGTVGKTHKQR